MKVNMTPNPLDVVTIHASQGDTEARQWEFELHNNGELIDTSDVKEQLFFKAYKGGTEQLLPENTSTPTTSPFIGDIRYPQGLLSDQEFTYRESPTESDGLAKITDIKGNTIVWNQLVQNGNFADTSNWSSSSNVSITASNNILRVTNAVGRDGDYYSEQNIPMKVGHKYYFHAEVKKTDVSTAQTLLLVYFGEGGNTFAIDASKENTNWISRSTIFTCVSNTYNFVRLRTQVANATNEFRNVVLIDLTQMGLDITDPSDFTSLFPLPYYAYNAGTLLSFNGTGVKTVGKNLLDPSSKTTYDGENGLRWYQSQGFMLMANKTYTFSASNTGGSSVAVYIIDHATRTALASSALVTTYTPTQNVLVYFQAYRGGGIPSGSEFQLEIGNQTEYEPYTSSTLSLPISTYFPNGMKSAGTVYDELTPKKAITRIGVVDLGSLTWTYTSGRFQTLKSNISPLPSSNANVLCSKYSYSSTAEVDKTINQTSNYFRVYDSSFTDADVFKQAMTDQNVKLYYELATPTETSFTTASLVTENAEIPLSNNDGTLIGKCTEQLSENPGFIDAKIKLSDADGECYSNKLQLHVERSPQ